MSANQQITNQQAVITAMSVLLSTTPDLPLGKLLNVCLMAKVENNSAAKAQELFDDPSKVAYWVQEVIGSDGKYTPEECQALGDMELTDVDSYVSELSAEIAAL
ncbi:hypothetical protein [cf. Phormidesmis sp. LEGE 11477]|uniref:hypothetical protein n=1 Tax=cf. Phormidesmis sp. LEGE 11477 TaxID=1828680 RepID=UPI001881D8CD|nr:hypothetical protein [cf. Phormidesmis sp. LEGE 11477]MBE9061978.1 hypothetical protein [cf. Phormidesmis sp. LEGE 11477]